MCLEHLWSERNAAVVRGALTSPSAIVKSYRERGIRQVRAIAMREHRAAAIEVRGARLYTCLEVLVKEPRRHPPYGGGQPRSAAATGARILAQDFSGILHSFSVVNR